MHPDLLQWREQLKGEFFRPVMESLSEPLRGVVAGVLDDLANDGWAIMPLEPNIAGAVAVAVAILDGWHATFAGILMPDAMKDVGHFRYWLRVNMQENPPLVLSSEALDLMAALRDFFRR